MRLDEARHVMTGELKVGSGKDVLTCLLGSCVGIGMIWKRGGRCGLAHCLLPDNTPGVPEAAARYVSLAVPALLTAMGVRTDQYDQVEVIVAGGARMLALASPGAIGLYVQVNVPPSARLSFAPLAGLSRVGVGGVRTSVVRIAEFTV